MENYYALWDGNKQNGRWNVIQVIGERARYYILKGNLEDAEVFLMLSAGWIEENEFTDGEDYIHLEKWTKYDGILIPFE